MKEISVRTRFAPSPTGYLHIGGVRTALFNWLYARHHGGQFILRVDDTDRERNLAEALQPILDGFRWLGLDWDEGPDVGGPHEPYFQSQRDHRYQAAVERLLADGSAYLDFGTPEEIQAEREQARQEKRRFLYSRRWMAETDTDAERFRAQGRASVVRLKMPREGQCAFVDLVRGPMAFDWALEQDHVIQRADGSCLYHLASTVDDHDFDITHVIRAVEHLSNTPRQIFIAEGLGYSLQRYAHLPYVAEPGSAEKLSKRKLDKYLKHPEFKKIYDHGARIMDALGVQTSPDTFNPVVVDFYREVGYRPGALVNYLLLLGWSLDDKTETFSREEMVRHFSLERVNAAAASFDPQKLLAFQERDMNAVPLVEKGALVLPFLQKAGLLPGALDEDDRRRVMAVVRAAGDRIKVAGDIVSYAEFFQADGDIVYDQKAFDKRLRADGAAARLGKFRAVLDKVDTFEASTLEGHLHRFVEAEHVKIGQVINAVRVAVTGRAVGFGLFEAMEILGRGACLARIDRAISLAAVPLTASDPSAAA